MNNRTWWVLGMVALVVLTWFGVLARQHATRQTVSVDIPVVTDVQLPGVEPANSAVAGQAIASQPASREGERSAAARSVPVVRSTSPATQLAAVKPRPTTYAQAVKEADTGNPEEFTPQKVARVALGFVGADPVAEQVWEAAINSPNFTPNERKDLIEDLNQEGFDDPKNPTQADLPLIVSRLQLIQNLAPQAADDVNAAAFAEAYKDLANMYSKLTK